MRKKILFLVLLIVGGLGIMGQSLKLDSSLSYDVNSATSYLDVRPDSSKSNATLTLDRLLSFLNTVTGSVNGAIDGLYDVDVTLIQNRLDTITGLLEGLDQATFDANKAFYYSQYEALFELYSYTLQSRNVEGRGMWHRPFETNLDAVRATLQSLSDMGINMLYVETFWMGKLIYDSQVPNTYQHYFTLGGYKDETVDYGTNLLKAFTEEGKQYGIEVHAWVENFFVGYGVSYTDSPILKQNLDWALYNYDGTIPQKREVNYLFMDPANPDCRDYLKAIYGEIALTIDIASIHLDYIRYPVAVNVTNEPNSNLDTGYSDYAEREFKLIYGYTGDLRTLVITNSQAAKDWKEYKTNVISDFVAGVYYVVKTNNPDVYLSTAIFGNVSSALDTKMQDWGSWIKDGYVELILPMAYYQSSITVRSEVQNLTNIVDDHAFSYAGIAPSFMGYNDHLNTTQIVGSLDGDAMGVTFFASQKYLVQNVDGTNNYNTKVQGILTNGAFRTDAIRPHDETSVVISAIFDLILDRADRIYIPSGNMTTEQRTSLANEFTLLQAMQVDTISDLSSLITALEGLQVDTYSSGEAINRINEEVQYLIDILTIKSERLGFDQSIDITVNPDQNTYFPDAIILTAPVNLSVTERYLTWDQVINAVQYEITINDEKYYTTETSIDLTNVQLRDGSNSVGIIAIGDDIYYKDSSYSDIYTFTVARLEQVEDLKINDNVLSFTVVEGAVEYIVKIGVSTIIVQNPYLNLANLELNSSEYDISVKAIGNGYTTIDGNYSSKITYKANELRIENIFLDLFRGFVTYETNQLEEE